MGEYDPDDSRDVTLSDHQAPGEPPRTGPREDAARRDAADGRPVNEELARKDASDAAQVERAQAEPADPERMAIDNPAGAARPAYDQYKLNDPQSLDKRGSDQEPRGEDDG